MAKQKFKIITGILNWKLIGIILFIVVLCSIDIPEVIRVLHDANWILVGLAMSLQMATVFLKSIRWHVLLRALNTHYPLWRGFALYAISGYMGVVTPARLGEFWKAIRLKQEVGVPLSRGVLATIVDRGIDFYFYFCIGTLCAAQVGLLVKLPLIGWIVLFGVVGIPLLLLQGGSRRRIASVLIPGRVLRQLGIDLKEAIDNFDRDCRRLVSFSLLSVIAITLVTTFILLIQFWLMLQSLRIEVSFLIGAMIISLLKFVGNIPVSIFGLGTRDLSLIFIFHMLDLPTYKAVGVSALVLVVNHIGISILGIAISLVMRTGPSIGASSVQSRKA